MNETTNTARPENRQLYTTHTPGPWATDIICAAKIIDREGVNSGRKNDTRIDCATVYVDHGTGKGSQVCSLPHNPDDGLDLHDAEYIANARLIAAAPELLAVAQDALDCIRRNARDISGWPDLKERLTAATAKATGEAR